jgi:CTP:molybdopterin cytidylyltransferase MocA
VIAGLVLAAGAGTRFGGRKQIAELEGRPLLEHALAAMESAPVEPVAVVLGADADAILGTVDLHGAEPIVCHEWEEGQSASLRTGIGALERAGADAVVVTLGDQPHLAARAIAAVVAARGDGTKADAVRATYDGKPGHPVLLERSLFDGVRALRGDTGARELLRDARVIEVPCDGLGDPADVDTPDDLR